MRTIFQFLMSKGVAGAFTLGMLITVLFLFIVMGNIDNFNALGKEAQYDSGIFDFGLLAAMGLAALCAIAMLAFGVIQVASDFGYLAEVVDKFNITDAQSGLISGAITTSLAMLGLAVLALVGTSIRNFFN